MVLLRDSYIVVVELPSYITIWRHAREDHCIWRNKERSRFCYSLFWISPQFVAFTGFCSYFLPPSFCVSLCLFHREIKFPKKVNIFNIKLITSLVKKKRPSTNILKSQVNTSMISIADPRLVFEPIFYGTDGYLQVPYAANKKQQFHYE